MARIPDRMAGVLVLIALIGLLMMMLVPAVSRSRKAARAAQCQDNLRRFGVGFQAHAQADGQTRFCTGAYDWERDGCPDTVGWVADLVNDGFCRPIDMLCPSNPMKGLEELQVLYSTTPMAGEGIDGSLLRAGICGEADAFVPGGRFGAEGSAKRREAIATYILDKGYSTNYTAHWFLVRGGPKVTQEDFQHIDGKIDGYTIRLASATSWKPRRNGATEICTGPLKRIDVQKSKMRVTTTPSAMIPLLADGAGSLGTNSKFENGPYVDSLTMSFSDGPATWSYSVHKIVPVAGKVVVGRVTGLAGSTPQWTGQIYEEAQGFYYGTVGLQDSRQFTCPHNGSANFVMADGSVREFGDQNGDKVLNPGFWAEYLRDGGYSASEEVPVGGDYSMNGYTGPPEDLPRTEVFSGLFIRNPLLEKGLPSAW